MLELVENRCKIIDDWSEYLNRLKATNVDLENDIEEAESLATIVGAIVEQRLNLELSQSALAKICGMSVSSIAKIESGLVIPNLSTLLNIFRKLGLKLSVTAPLNSAR